jgi:hypothetical protein
MSTKHPPSEEALAAERVVQALREVRAVAAKLERYLDAKSDEQPTALELARLKAAAQELEDARAAFDALVRRDGERR